MMEFLYTLIIYPVYELIEIAFVFFTRLFVNYGIAVIGVSFAVTIFCLPLYIVAERWQETERNIQSKLKSGIERIKNTFKGDEQYMILSTFYKQNHYHPMMALRSSFGLLIQIPFFMAAYSFLSSLEVLKGEPFLFIRNMGAPDALFTIGGFSINVLPIAMTLINCVAGAIYSRGRGAREQIQIYAMAAIFLVILYNSPAGLVLYWTMNNIFSLVKNVFYKFKKPLRALYIAFCVADILSIIMLCVFKIGATKKRIVLIAVLLLLLLLPFYIKFVGYLLKNYLNKIVQDNALRFKIFISSAIGLTLLFGLVVPSSLISNSVQEFSDIGSAKSPLFFIFNTLVQSAGLFLLWPICIYFLFHARIQTIISTVFAAGLLCAVVNVFGFAGNYGNIDNALIFTDGLKQMQSWQILLNAFVLFAAIVAVIAILKFAPNYVGIICALIAIPFLAMGIFNCTKISGEYKDFEKMVATQPKDNSLEPIFTLSKNGKNVIVLMLDRAENAYVERIFNEIPRLKESFSGFVSYKNNVSYNGHTLLSSPSIFGGYEYTPYEMNSRTDKKNVEKFNESLLMMGRVFTEQADFTAVLSDMPWANFSYVPDMSITEPYPKIAGINIEKKYTYEWQKLHPEFLAANDSIYEGLKRNLLFFSLFRASPAFIRNTIYYQATWMGLGEFDNMATIIDNYAPLDFLPQITKTASDSQNNFICFHNDLTHSNEILPPPNYMPSIDKSKNVPMPSGYSTNAAAYILLAKWFDYLKANGCYDNTRIILVSDHGIGDIKENYDNPILSNGDGKDHLNAIFMVKDFDSTESFRIDINTFTTTADVPLTALKGIVENPVNPFTGNKIDDSVKQKYGAVVCTSHRHKADEHLKPYRFTISDDEYYTVKDNIFIDKNWTQGVPK